MSVALVTGSSGLIGSETVRFFHDKGFDVVGIDNNLRAYFFGKDGSTDWKAKELERTFSRYTHVSRDIRNKDGLDQVFRRFGKDIEIIVHCAAQPSHDWAAREPVMDFSVNALATLYLLECTREHCPSATFIYTSTNKVYGDTPNSLPLVERETRWECDPAHPYAQFGIDESMTIDDSKHSVFGASKLAADVMCQEYGKYFGLNVGIFRGGCLTGPAHSGAELHGFLAYLVKCQITGRRYNLYGYKGKQVRDNIHSRDLVNAFWHFHQQPRQGEVYNIGGSRHSNCSVLEAMAMVEKLSGRALQYQLLDEPRIGDHIWWISDVRKFQSHYPFWKYEYGIEKIIEEIVEATWVRERKRMKLSVIIPGHNEEKSITPTVEGIVETLDQANIPHEVVLVNDNSSDNTEIVYHALSERFPSVRYVNNLPPNGYGLAVRKGLETFSGDAVAIVMADASDDPNDLVNFYQKLEQGYDCVFGTRWQKGGKVYDYPLVKRIFNRLGNHLIQLLFQIRYDDVTNAFKMFRREVVFGLQPFFSNHFNLTVELPLKAIVRGYSYAVVPNSWRNRKEGVAKMKIKEIGSRYLFVIFYCLLEKWLSSADYHKTTVQNFRGIQAAALPEQPQAEKEQMPFRALPEEKKVQQQVGNL